MTDLQLSVLRILWAQKESTATEVQSALRPAHNLAITTVSTLLGRMVKRGDVVMRRDGRQFYYAAQVTEADISARKLQEVAKLLFSGSAAAAIAHLLDTTALDPGELKELQRRIAEKEASPAKRRKK